MASLVVRSNVTVSCETIERILKILTILATIFIQISQRISFGSLTNKTCFNPMITSKAFTLNSDGLFVLFSYNDA